MNSIRNNISTIKRGNVFNNTLKEKAFKENIVFILSLTKNTNIQPAYTVYNDKDEDNGICSHCHRYINEDELSNLEDKQCI
jgi:hypothetical protein